MYTINKNKHPKVSEFKLTYLIDNALSFKMFKTLNADKGIIL